MEIMEINNIFFWIYSKVEKYIFYNHKRCISTRTNKSRYSKQMSYTIPGKESIGVFATYTVRATEPLLTILNKHINIIY